MLQNPTTKRDHKEATNKEGQPIGKVGHRGGGGGLGGPLYPLEVSHGSCLWYFTFRLIDRPRIAQFATNTT